MTVQGATIGVCSGLMRVWSVNLVNLCITMMADSGCGMNKGPTRTKGKGKGW